MKCYFAILLAVAAATLSGCATSSQARNVEATGFLGNCRELLQPGKPGEEQLLVYRNPKADWKSYKKIVVEPVSIWSDPKQELSSDERQDLQKLVDNFQTLLRAKLAADYEIVERKGPGVLISQVALTSGEQAYTSLKVVSKAVPYGSAASYLWTFMTGKAPFVGEASLEWMVKDAETGDILSASVDRRVGADTFVGGGALNMEYFNSLGGVKS